MSQKPQAELVAASEQAPDAVTPSVAAIISSAFELTTRLDQQSVLQALVDSAVALTGARYGALAVLGSHGETAQLIFTGLDYQRASAIGRPAQDRGVIADIPGEGYLIIDDLSNYSKNISWPTNHPEMTNFLGVAVRIRGRLFGHLMLANKTGSFSSSDGQNMLLLAQAAGIALENARLYAESNTRAQWIAASRAITTALLEGTDEEEALQLIAKEMRRVAKADVALIVLPSVGDTWACEIADGEGAEKLIGTVFPPEGRAQAVIREGSGLIVDTMQRQKNLLVEGLARFGPALYAPMVARGSSQGVIVLLRNPDKPEFDLSDLSMAENVAKQAALALELASARHAQAQADQMEDRARISRDLHDFAIQQLFASGMELTAAREDLANEETVPRPVLASLDRAIKSIDESVAQIRQIIYSLRDPQATVPLVDRLRRETTSATSSLGFSPGLTISNLGSIVTSGSHTEIDDELGADLSDDVVAVVRECLSNAARHAQANTVDIAITIESHRVKIVVCDDGRGIDRTSSRRSGLSNLAARARRHQGTFSIRPVHGTTGTKVEWTALVD
ncbi:MULTISPECIES: GAF domain-containing protein [unclassified Actinobaculum]|uniref:sensor histidine kinase n=1 Tax=unclassified Actinobaculum TaxID=2609299 RepID=UPI000D528E09|nr:MULTISPECIES: GAF domain-containing protein [unclassified Actinobaculum]AWE42218.1 histidine kinase [Actinobaculum sp. 313]RTE50781.1 GAF domain-containing protein [Actinobaculum sp. 352]